MLIRSSRRERPHRALQSQSWSWNNYCSLLIQIYVGLTNCARDSGREKTCWAVYREFNGLDFKWRRQQTADRVSTLHSNWSWCQRHENLKKTHHNEDQITFVRFAHCLNFVVKGLVDQINQLTSENPRKMFFSFSQVMFVSLSFPAAAAARSLSVKTPLQSNSMNILWKRIYHFQPSCVLCAKANGEKDEIDNKIIVFLRC